MPGVPETAWGVWGEPGPIKPWEHGAPKLHGDTGGDLKPEFSDSLKWFYRRAINPKDKEHCLRLLAQIQLKQEDASKRSPNLAIHGRSVRSPTSPKRPSSAKVFGGKSTTRTYRERPRTALPSKKTLVEFANLPQDTRKEETGKSMYQRQQKSIERLSKPKAAKPVPQTYTQSRPKSAMATIGRKSYSDPYLTTHEREYPGYSSGMCAEAERPTTSKGFTAPYELSGPIGRTTSEEEFGWKEAAKTEPIRSGTSSGNRRNNPHPHQAFMVWKLPNDKSVEGIITATSPHLQYRDLTADALNEILRDQMKSTYQSDYLGIPQGYEVKEAIDAPPDWRKRIRRPLDTTVRYTYLRPQKPDELVGNTTRYGCNKNKGIPALGTVPTVTLFHIKNQEAIKKNTTYDKEYRNRHGQPDLEQLLNNQPNKRALDRFLRYAKTDFKTTSEERGSVSSQKGPRWVTKWEGPHHQEYQ